MFLHKMSAPLECFRFPCSLGPICNNTLIFREKMMRSRAFSVQLILFYNVSIGRGESMTLWVRAIWPYRNMVQPKDPPSGLNLSLACFTGICSKCTISYSKWISMLRFSKVQRHTDVFKVIQTGPHIQGFSDLQICPLPMPIN